MQSHAKILIGDSVGRALPMSEYQAHPALSRSTLDKIRRSPAHLKWALANGSGDSDAFRVGRLIHGLLLEPETFWEGLAVWEGGRRAGKVWEAFKADAESLGKEILKAEEISSFSAISNSFEAKGLRARARGQVERSLFWRDQKTGLELKGRPDVIGDDGDLYDLKTTQDASTEEFLKSAYRYGYHRQAAWYLDGVAAMGMRPGNFVIIAIEKEAPYEIQSFVLSSDFIELGRRENEANLDLFMRCKRANEWPGYDSTPQLLCMPPWLQDLENANE